VLNLAAANVAQEMKLWKCIFSSFNSLWKVLHQSPKCHNKFLAVQHILQDSSLELVRVGDTRWTSNYRAVTAIANNLHAIVLTLQELHSESGDLSSEAGGLLLTFQDGTRTAQNCTVCNFATIAYTHLNSAVGKIEFDGISRESGYDSCMST